MATAAPGIGPQVATRRASTDDDRVFLYGVTWDAYERILDLRGERSRPRIQYLDGTVEIMSPGGDHEVVKTRIGRLFEAFTEEIELDANGYGSWTLKKELVKRGVEPDECYVRGGKAKRRPDLAIEVMWTRGGLDKLELYRKLGVRELWLWTRAKKMSLPDEQGRIAIFTLRREQYVEVAASVVFPEVDVELLAELATMENQREAVRELRARVRLRR